MCLSTCVCAYVAWGGGPNFYPVVWANIFCICNKWRCSQIWSELRSISWWSELAYDHLIQQGTTKKSDTSWTDITQMCRILQSQQREYFSPWPCFSHWQTDIELTTETSLGAVKSEAIGSLHSPPAPPTTSRGNAAVTNHILDRSQERGTTTPRNFKLPTECVRFS